MKSAAFDSSSREVFACVLCAREVVAAGGARVNAPREIRDGRHCDVHVGDFVVQASEVVRLPESWKRAVVVPVAEEPLPQNVGPVTVIAAQLLAAWTTDGADDAMIAGAVDAAKSLLRRTKGV